MYIFWRKEQCTYMCMVIAFLLHGNHLYSTYRHYSYFYHTNMTIQHIGEKLVKYHHPTPKKSAYFNPLLFDSSFHNQKMHTKIPLHIFSFIYFSFYSISTFLYLYFRAPTNQILPFSSSFSIFYHCTMILA